jgi:hypothetical protein
MPQLVRLHFYSHPAFNLFSVCECDLQEDNPASPHAEIKIGLISSGFAFLAVGKDWSHTRMRHVAFRRNMRPRHRSRGGVAQIDSDDALS